MKDVLCSLGVHRIEMARDGDSGFSVARKVSPNPYVAVIMLTSYCEQHHVIEARDVGVNEFLVKPISVKALYNRIVEVIEFSRSYVISFSYTGPSRRRNTGSGYIGSRRRQADREEEETAAKAKAKAKAEAEEESAAKAKAEKEAAAMSQDEVVAKLGKKTND